LKRKTTKFILGIFLVLFLILSLAAPVFAADLTGVTNTPTDNAAGATTTHTVAFTTATSLPASGKMKVAFPDGFNVSGATLGAVTGPDGNFTLSRDGQVLIVSRSGGTAFGAAAVTVAFNGVVNHQTVGAAYTVDVVTTDSFNGYIDGPTTSDVFAIVPADLDALVVVQQPTPTVAGVAIAPAVTVRAEDEFDNVIAGVDVNVEEAGGYVFDAGTLQQTTDATGIATFADLVINIADTDYVLRFSDDATGLITVDSDEFDVVPDALNELVVVDQPIDPTVAGVAIGPVMVQALDQFGNPRAGDAIDVVEKGGYVFDAGTLQQPTGADGIATFADLEIDTADTGYILTFSSGGAFDVDSNPFDVVALDQLVITNQPVDTIAGVAIGPVTVQALDTLGAPIAGIVVGVAELSEGYVFDDGTLQQTTGADGIATFDDLVIITAKADYQLGFSSGAVNSDPSDLFDVVPAGVETLTVEVQPTDAEAGAVIAPAVEVKAVDEFNNLIEGLDIDASLLVGTGTLSGTTPQVTVATGIATFGDFSIDLPGTKQLQFAADGVTVDSIEFNVGTASVELEEGWNLMSLPLIPDDTDIEDVLAGIEADVLSVWYYDAAINDWLIYAPPAFNSLTTLEDGKAYWFNMDAQAELWIDGRELPAPPGLPPVYDVVAGWNMVGFKSTADMSAADYLNAMAGKYTRIYGFDNGAWFTIPPPDYTNPQMIPGLGYWISFTEDGAIYP
jgi:hypothetical protein